MSKLVYLSIIDALATNFSTINTVLQRSKKIADELDVQYVSLVRDEAIYSNIQEIRWKDITCGDHFVIHTGAFHMAVSFSEAIAKLFRDAALKVNLAFFLRFCLKRIRSLKYLFKNNYVQVNFVQSLKKLLLVISNF